MTAQAGGGRTARVHRITSESEVLVELGLDGTGRTDIATGVPFYDHMLSQLGPGYRQGGYARAIMEDVLAWFDHRGRARVDLGASPDGQGLCWSLGFHDHPDPPSAGQARLDD